MRRPGAALAGWVAVHIASVLLVAFLLVGNGEGEKRKSGEEN